MTTFSRTDRRVRANTLRSDQQSNRLGFRHSRRYRTVN